MLFTAMLWAYKRGSPCIRTTLQPRRNELAAEFSWHSKWWSLLLVTAQLAFALSLIGIDCDAIKRSTDFEPKIGEILADVRYEMGPRSDSETESRKRNETF